jgi:hypothetical protein
MCFSFDVIFECSDLVRDAPFGADPESRFPG